MSLDIDIGDEEFNITYNYSYALPERLRNWSGLPGFAVEERVLEAIEHLAENYDSFVEQEPRKCNGWGTMELLAGLLVRMLAACKKYPDAIVEVL